MTTKIIRCPICERRTREVDLWTKNSFRYVRCANCGLIYINPQLSDEAVAEIYSNVLYDQKSERLDLLLPTLDGYKLRLLRKFERFRKSGYLLDIGCFKGFFLYSAAHRGWKTFGTEVSEPAARFAREKLGQQVERGELLDMPHLEDYGFDVITLFDVIEHLSRPDRYLKKAHRLLRRGGLLYMETPNFNALPRFLLGKRWTVFNCLHRYYFVPNTMVQILHKVGFMNIKIRTVGFLPMGTREDEPGAAKAESKPKLVRFLPINLLRDIQDIVESVVFFPLDLSGLKVGTKIVVWATKEA